MRWLSLSLIAMTLTTTTAVHGRQTDRVSEPEARKWAAEAAAIANGNVKRFNSEFEKRAKARLQDYRAGGGNILPPARSLSAKLYGQVAAFQFSASETVRQVKPLGEARFPAGPILEITTNLMTAPLIDRAVVKRGAQVIDPIENHITDTKASNLLGAVFDAREGQLVFPVAAFEPVKGTVVTIMLIPLAGRNIEVRLSASTVEAAFEKPR